jgi:hypothetical protein
MCEQNKNKCAAALLFSYRVTLVFEGAFPERGRGVYLWHPRTVLISRRVAIDVVKRGAAVNS